MLRADMYDLYRKEAVVYLATATGAPVSYTMQPGDQVVIVDFTVASENATLTLPNIKEAAGKFYTIRVNLAAATSEIFLDVPGDETPNFADIESASGFSAAGDYLVLYSDGFIWMPVHNLGVSITA